MRKSKENSTFRVECDFEKGLTKVHHNSPDFIEIKPCSTEMCFNYTVHYDAKMDHIYDLMSITGFCYQEIEFKCFHAPFTNDASYTSGFGKHCKHFAGDYFTEMNNCNCLIEDTCYTRKPGKFIYNDCNCDENDAEWRSDKIEISQYGPNHPRIKTYDYGWDEKEVRKQKSRNTYL